MTPDGNRILPCRLSPTTAWGWLARERLNGSFQDCRHTRPGDPPSIALEDAESGSVWVADPTHTEFLGTDVENPSLVVLAENDGLMATGTAVFVDGQALDRGEAVEPLEGTWEVRCDKAG